MQRSRYRREGHFEWMLLVLVAALSLLGLLCISMATYNVEVSEGAPLLNKILNSRSSMWQSIFIIVSPIVFAVVLSLPTELLRSRARIAYYGVLGLLVLTLVMGQVSNNLRGWLKSSILGRSIQPSEFAKLVIILMLARQFARSEKPMTRLRDFSVSAAIVGVPVLVILAQGETGTVIVIAFVFWVMLFFAGGDMRFLGIMVAAVFLLFGLLVYYGTHYGTTDYRILRLLAFLDPQKYELNGGYQIIMSKDAIGSGQLMGRGTFVQGSFTTLQFVPESSTDSIFTVVGESFGFIGSVAVLTAYFLMVIRMLYLAQRTSDKFRRLVIIGVMSMFLFHVFQNIAMSMGIMPITGIPLPFLSYGGSNYISNIAAIAVVMNIARGGSEVQAYAMPAPREKIQEERKGFFRRFGAKIREFLTTP